MKDLIHPITKERINPYDIEGKELLKHYIRLVQKGSSNNKVIKYNVLNTKEVDLSKNCNDKKEQENNKLCCLQWWKHESARKHLNYNLNGNYKIKLSKKEYLDVIGDAKKDLENFPWLKLSLGKMDIRKNLTKNIFNDFHKEFDDSDKELYSDERRFIKSILTDFVVKEMFKDEEQLYQFLKYIFTIYYYGLEKYRKTKNLPKNSIIFLYKGGNVLRIIEKGFMFELPGKSRDILQQFYSPFFKRGDADFGIYIKPDLRDYQQIYDEVTYLSYYLQSNIRNYMIQNKLKFFSIYKYSPEYLSNLLKTEIFDKLINEDLQDNEAWKDVTFLNVVFEGENVSAIPRKEVIDKLKNMDSNKFTDKDNYNNFLETYEKEDYNGEYDYLVQFKNKPNPLDRRIPKVMEFWTKKDTPKSVFRVSYNKSLSFYTAIEREVPMLKIFNLVRSKAQFRIDYLDSNGILHKKSMGGELIDVSIAHRCADIETQTFFHNINNNISKYQISHHSNNDEKLEFLSYSLHYIVDDLEKMLYHENIYPWIDKKYEKRVNRLFYLCFIELFKLLQNNELRKLYIISMKNYFNAVKKGNEKKVDKYFQLLYEFEDIDKLDIKDLQKYSSQKGGSSILIQSLLAGSVFLLGYQVLKNKKTKSIKKDNKLKEPKSVWEERSSTESSTYISINESTFLFYRLLSRVHHVIRPDINKQVLKKHKGDYINFIDVLINNCDKILSVFPPNLKTGLCIYDNTSILDDKVIKQTNMMNFS